MCLIITLKHDTPELPDDLILGVYNRNRDGIGVMWSEDNHLCYDKIIPKSAKEALEFYRRLTKDKTCAVHFRLRTHGAIDYENCHPYEVFGFDKEADMPMLLMHNGVLHTGNHHDTTKSDTWHYVRDYLHKLLAADPSLAFTPEFADVIGKHIGNNRFVLMNHQGDMAIVNKDQGVEYKGAWMSNTYAWEYARFVPPARSSWAWGESRTSWVENRKGDWVPAKPATKSQLPRPKSPPRTYQPPLELEWDIREVVATLDEAYPDNDFTARQVQTLIEELGTTMVYVLMDDLTDGKLTRADFEKMLGSRLSMRAWLKKNTPAKATTP